MTYWPAGFAAGKKLTRVSKDMATNPADMPSFNPEKLISDFKVLNNKYDDSAVTLFIRAPMLNFCAYDNPEYWNIILYQITLELVYHHQFLWYILTEHVM